MGHRTSITSGTRRGGHRGEGLALTCRSVSLRDRGSGGRSGASFSVSVLADTNF
jgi:hypothetical protein